MSNIEHFMIGSYGEISPGTALVPEPHSSPLRAAEQRMAVLLTFLAEALKRSCIYLTPEKEATVTLPDTASLLQELDGRMRGLVVHNENDHVYEKRREQVPLTVRNLKAAADAISHAREHFRMLRKAELPPSGMAPLARMTDQLINLFAATAVLLEQDDRSAARSAIQAVIQSKERCDEMQGIVNDLSAFLPQKSTKLMKACVDYLMVGHDSVAQVARMMASQMVAPSSEAPLLTATPNRPAAVAPLEQLPIEGPLVTPSRRPNVVPEAMPIAASAPTPSPAAAPEQKEKQPGFLAMLFGRRHGSNPAR